MKFYIKLFFIRINTKMALAVALSIFSYAYQEEIKTASQKIIDALYYNAYRDVKIDVKSSPKMAHAINELLKEYISQEDSKSKKYIDGYDKMQYEIENGQYTLLFYLDKDEDKIVLHSRDKKELKERKKHDKVYFTESYSKKLYETYYPQNNFYINVSSNFKYEKIHLIGDKPMYSNIDYDLMDNNDNEKLKYDYYHKYERRCGCHYDEDKKQYYYRIVRNYEDILLCLWIKKTDDTIWISCKQRISQEKLENFCNEIYNYYNSPEKSIMYYMSIDKQWKYPILRRPRNVNSINITSSMQNVLDDVDNFMQNSHNYELQGLPYKRGYLFQGKSGTGKTTLAELISIKYNRSIYLVSLNSGTMDDSALVNLLSDVPAYSLIVFEEIDRQIETLKTNKNINISDGGILTAIDGPQRLSHGTIIIMTSNNAYEFSKTFKDALFRKGRIDKTFQLE